MPNYSTGKRKKKRKPKQTPATTRNKRPPHITRDRRILLHWAARGSPIDYAKLREYALEARKHLPVSIDGVAFDKLLHADRGLMVEALQDAEAHADPDADSGFFVDALNWLLDWVPPPFNWGTKIWQQSMQPYKGDNENAVDRTYASLVGATYDTTMPHVLDHYKRQAQFDSEYIAVWDSPDGHRLIAVRGTKLSHLKDLGQDVRIALTGGVGDELSSELLRILAATPKDVTVDLAAHSLGTSLALKAYDMDPRIYNAIHETYLYNPAYSPFVGSAMIARYEADENVRFFVNTGDLVSIGGLGAEGPVNAVYHHDGKHSLSQWQWPEEHGKTYYEPPPDRVHVHPQPMTVTKRGTGLHIPKDAGPDYVIPPQDFWANTIVPSVNGQDAEHPEGGAAPPDGDLAEHVEVDFGHEDFESILATL
jgi:hypothetical protein